MVGAFLAEGTTHTWNDEKEAWVQGRWEEKVELREVGEVGKEVRKSWGRHESLDEVGGSDGRKQRGKNSFFKSRDD